MASIKRQTPVIIGVGFEQQRSEDPAECPEAWQLMADAVRGVLAGVTADTLIDVPEDDAKAILEAANIVTLARTGVEYDYRGDVINAHAPEMPTRFAKQLTQVFRGAIAIGIVSWLGEGLAYYIVLVGFGAPLGLTAAWQAVFIFSVSTIIGAVVATPGGLGATEASLVALSQSIYGLDRTAATAAALVIRLCTLWFGVGIGLLCLLRWPDLLAGAPEAPEPGLAEAT